MGVRFTRTSTMARGKTDEAMAFAARVSEYVSENMGVEVKWGGQVGGTTGCLHWYVDYDDMAHMERVLGATLMDEGYKKLVDDAADLFEGPAQDTIVYLM